MNKIKVIAGIVTIICSPALSQYEIEQLDANAANALISNDGTFFQDHDAGLAAYEIPAGSGNKAFYNTSFWYAGRDINGQLKGVFQQYAQGEDLFPGARKYGAVDIGDPIEQGGVHAVTSAQIEEHIASFGTVGYSTPDALLDWPAHGDISEDYDFDLAPFVDVNGNGIYEPDVAGDYPKIKGDKAVYLIMNDVGGIHASGADPIGIEIHYMFYQYANEGGAIDSTTFLNMRVINRGTQTLFDFRVGIFVDPDLGDGEDDFVGFNEAQKLAYAYNGDNFDGGTGGAPGYGDRPPAAGVTLLNQNARAFGVVNYGGAISPSTPFGFYGFMGAQHPDGTPFQEGNYLGEESDFMFPGDPTAETVEGTEGAYGNPSGERQFMMSTEKEVYAAFEILCFDYAFVFATGEDRINSVTKLFEATEEVRDFYDVQPDSYCLEGFLGLEEEATDLPLLNVYPNPSNGQFTITSEGEFDFQLIGIDGRVILQENGVQDQLLIDESLASGTYMIRITQNQKNTLTKLVIR